MSNPLRTTVWHMRRRNLDPPDPGNDEVGLGAGLEVPHDFFDGLLYVNSGGETSEDEGSDEGDDSDHFPWQEPVNMDEPNQQKKTLDLFSKQICEAVGSNILSQQGATTVLKILHSTVSKYLPTQIRMGVPKDFRTLSKHAGVREPPFTMRHLCPRRRQNKTFEDHHMFSEDPDDAVCPKCNLSTRYLPSSILRPARQVRC